MRMQLAELQRRYKEKQRELARLQRRHDHEYVGGWLRQDWHPCSPRPHLGGRGHARMSEKLGPRSLSEAGTQETWEGNFAQQGN